MNMTKRGTKVFVSISTLLVIFMPPITAFGQTAGSTGSSIDVTRTPYLSFNQTPTSFSFPSTATSGVARHVLSNTDGNLDCAASCLIVEDTRNSGGFVVQAQSTDFISGNNIISASGLRIVSTSSINTTISGFADNDVFYATENNAPNRTINTPVSATGTGFGHPETFDQVQNRPQNNTLDKPVDIMSSCLPPTTGRDYSVAVGLAFDLMIPAYAIPGSYNSTITYTIIDYTQDSCP